MQVIKLSDWKSILDQLKTAALKAGGGTGISKAIRNCEAAHRAYSDHPALTTADHYSEELTAFMVVCDTTVKKHGRRFVTACAYLTRLSHEADHETKELKQHMIQQQRDRKELERKRREAAKEHARQEKLRVSLKECCAHARKPMEQAKDMQQPMKAWHDFIAGLKAATKEARDYKTWPGRLEAYTPNQKASLDALKRTGLDHTAFY